MAGRSGSPGAPGSRSAAAASPTTSPSATAATRPAASSPRSSPSTSRPRLPSPAPEPPMKAGSALALLIGLLGAGLCARLGVWQISRWHEKQARNAAFRAALTSEPLAVSVPLPAAAAVENHRVAAVGTFDESRQVLLSGREPAELPGVGVVTPLLLPGDSAAVLVDRGWLYAPDQVHARPQDFREKSPRAVLGLARALGRRGGGLPMFTLESDTSHALWSARALDPDSL